ncbi:MAG: DUF4349 domain-containing protein [Opitutae bacterium]|jgi:hypothetical protein|nr:DUF4349 domain-containing protein [Opitutae bacterium]
MTKRDGKPSSYYPSLVFLSLFASFFAGCSESPMVDGEMLGGMEPSWQETAKASAGKDLSISENAEELTDSGGESDQLADRKIIYVSEIWLVLKKTTFEQFEKDIKVLVDTHDGYHSEVNFHRNQGQNRSGHWVFRVPVDHYQSFLKSAKDLGVPEQVQETARDVTDEYVDLDARISNQKRLEQRILDVLDEVQGKIGDVLEVEQQLSRVRETIERLEGKMRQLKDRVSMTTITLNVREDAEYQPPQALSFGSSIGNAWNKSIAAMEIFFKGLTLAIVALSPWLLILIPLGYLFYRLLRRLCAKRK